MKERKQSKNSTPRKDPKKEFKAKLNKYFKGDSVAEKQYYWQHNNVINVTRKLVVHYKKNFFASYKYLYERNELPPNMLCSDKIGVYDDSLIKELWKKFIYDPNGVAKDFISYQDTINDCANRLLDILTRYAFGVLTVEDGSVDLNALEKEGLTPGKVLIYRQGAEQPKTLEEVLPENLISLYEIYLKHFEATIQGLKEDAGMICRDWLINNGSFDIV